MHVIALCEYAFIAQLDRVADYESVGYRFDSYWTHQFGFAVNCTMTVTLFDILFGSIPELW